MDLRQQALLGSGGEFLPGFLHLPPDGGGGLFLLGLLLALVVEQSLGEHPGVKGLQVVDLLPHADELHRQIQIPLDGQHHAALGGAVQFGQHNAGDPRGALELPGLVHRVLAGGGVQDQQGLPVAARQLPVDDAGDLPQLVHQVLFIVQPPGGVADDHIAVPGLGGGDGVEHHRRGVGPLPVLDEGHPGPLGPHLQLLDGRRPEGVRRAQNHRLALSL